MLYSAFNYVEAALWFAVAGVILFRVSGTTRLRRAAMALAVVSFVLFGVSDILEAPYAGRLPSWLWGLKVACGAGILAARYTYVGWRTLRWHDRELLFALACLACVLAAIMIQQGRGERG